MNLLEILTTAEKIEAYLDKIRPGNPKNIDAATNYVNTAIRNDLIDGDKDELFCEKLAKSELLGLVSERPLKF